MVIVNVEGCGLSGIINGGHLFSVFSYGALQVFWHYNWRWLSDYKAHLPAGPFEQHTIEQSTPVDVYKVIDMGLVKEVLVNKVYLGIGAKEPQNEGVITAIKGSKVINHTPLHFFLVDGQIVGPRVNKYVVLPG